MHWMLLPVDHRVRIWDSYPVQRVVVEASNEVEARQKVAGAAPVLDEPNPWLDPAMTRCEQTAVNSPSLRAKAA